jgi:hypothetical protein
MRLGYSAACGLSLHGALCDVCLDYGVSQNAISLPSPNRMESGGSGGLELCHCRFDNSSIVLALLKVANGLQV